MKILVLGLSISSSWGNGHATTYRSLGRALYELGHRVIFVEKDVAWYREHRDLPSPDFCELRLYSGWDEEQVRTIQDARDADVIVIGSYFPDAIAAADILFEKTAKPVFFYDIDTPVTMAALCRTEQPEYLRVDQIPMYSAYLSFSGGPVLVELEKKYGARAAFPLYCSVDPDAHRQSQPSPQFASELSYMGTYAADRQPKLMNLLNGAAMQLPDYQFLVAGPLYPMTHWAMNVRHLQHVGPAEHASFYSSSRYTLNLTREDMVEAGYSPSVRLFEAASCGATILSDTWPGLNDFLQIGQEILVVTSTSDVVNVLRDLSEHERRAIGSRARERILNEHTSRHRALEFEQIVTKLSA